MNHQTIQSTHCRYLEALLDVQHALLLALLGDVAGVRRVAVWAHIKGDLQQENRHP
jgi:hypothetical protein